jgi:RNA polymerase sigma factor (sigma-70 family)
MDELIKLARTYRFTTDLSQRLRLGEEICTFILPDLRLFIVSAVSGNLSAEDVLQETIVAIVTGLMRFKGNTVREFWAFCYRIARNKLNDHFRKKSVETQRLEPLPPEDIWELVEASAQVSPLATGERLDLEYAMKLLAASKPECARYLWRHFVLGLDYAEIAEEQMLDYDNVRMKIGRCLEEAKSLVT